MPFPGSQTLGADFRRRTPPGPTILKLVRRLQLRGPQLDPREMAPGPPALLLLSLLSLPSLPPGATGCPAACRCYSATVECGALRLRVVPPGIPPGTQVGTVGATTTGGVCVNVLWVDGAPTLEGDSLGGLSNLPPSLWPADAIPAGQQHRAPGARHPGASCRPAPSLPAQQQPARPGARRLWCAVTPVGAGTHRQPATWLACGCLLRPGPAAHTLPSW